MSMTLVSLLIVHVASTWFLVGLCWLVQRVQYPLMATVRGRQFVAYEESHVARIAPLVGPVMALELSTAIALVASGEAAFRTPVFVFAGILILAIWSSTFLVQVPLHDVLARGFDDRAHARLVRTNWFRTCAWSLRGLLVALVIADLMGRIAT